MFPTTSAKTNTWNVISSVDLLDRVDLWRRIAGYLYVGFGGIYFEDFKLLHSHFGMRKMLSIENQNWGQAAPKVERALRVH